jgi:hypothetical protein
VHVSAVIARNAAPSPMHGVLSVRLRKESPGYFSGK